MSNMIKIFVLGRGWVKISEALAESILWGDDRRKGLQAQALISDASKQARLDSFRDRAQKFLSAHAVAPLAVIVTVMGLELREWTDADAIAEEARVEAARAEEVASALPVFGRFKVSLLPAQRHDRAMTSSQLYDAGLLAPGE